MAFAFAGKQCEKRWGHAKEEEEKGEHTKKNVFKYLLYVYIYTYIYCLYKFTLCLSRAKLEDLK